MTDDPVPVSFTEPSHHVALGYTPFVAVPAKNEAERLPSLLQGLAGQDWIASSGRPLAVVVVLNNCIDESRRVAERWAASLPVLSVRLVDVRFDEPEAHVGSARRLAMETALEMASGIPEAALLTTDADAVPAPDWVSANLRHLGDGIDLVGGLIVGDAVEEERLGTAFNHRAMLHQRYDRALDRLSSLLEPAGHDPWPRHTDHTGASLAVKASVYRHVGGLPPLPYREDLALVEAVREAGFRIRHPLDVVVKVSARLDGRAPGGMADCLKIWLSESATGEPVLVEHPHASRDRFDRSGAGACRCDAESPARLMEIGQATRLLESMVADLGALDAA